MEFPKLSELLAEARDRKEEWLWDKVIPLRDLTLLAAFMKKGKTTLLTGLVNALIRTGAYCGRGVQGGRRVLYLAPEEGDTLLNRFGRLGFVGEDDPFLTVVPRGNRIWGDLITRYRMREWSAFVNQLKKDDYDTVVLDGLHTLLKMFEPGAKEDNDGVSQFMTQFVLPFGGMTVVASLHTKKTGDPRLRLPPEEMIRGASAWMAHPGQVLVMEHDRKADLKMFHAFGRYESSQAHGMILKYDVERHDYVAVGEGTGEDEAVEAVREDVNRARIQASVIEKVRAVGEEGITLKALYGAITGRKATIAATVEELVASGVLVKVSRKGANGRLGEFLRLVEVGQA